MNVFTTNLSEEVFSKVLKTSVSQSTVDAQNYVYIMVSADPVGIVSALFL
jgi:hypothetical protein